MRQSKLRQARGTKRKLQAFLGLISFYSSVLEGKAEVAEPLHCLLDHDRKWAWTQEHERAIRKLKGLLSSDAVLVRYDPKRPLILSCDASPVGVGSVLSHRNDDSTESPLAYASRTLGRSERNYAQIDKEGLAVVYRVKHFHQYLAGRAFTIMTDHKPLLGIFNTEKPVPQIFSPRTLRWNLLLGAYNYELVFRPGTDNSNADGLSRLPAPGDADEPVPPGDVLLLEALEYPPLQATDIARLTNQDPSLARVKRWIFSGWPQQSLGGIFAPFEVRLIKLYCPTKCNRDARRVIVSESATRKVYSCFMPTTQE